MKKSIPIDSRSVEIMDHDCSTFWTALRGARGVDLDRDKRRKRLTADIFIFVFIILLLHHARVSLRYLSTRDRGSLYEVRK